MIDLPGRTRNVVARRQGRAHVLIGEHVARTHDHGGEGPGKIWFELQPSKKRNGFPLDRHSAFRIMI
jgi:hypothetical protein